MHYCVHVRNPDPKFDPSDPSHRINVWIGGKQNRERRVDGLSLECQQSAAHGKQQRDDGRVVLVCLSFQGLLVGLVRGGRALGCRHGGGW